MSSLCFDGDKGTDFPLLTVEALEEISDPWKAVSSSCRGTVPLAVFGEHLFPIKKNLKKKKKKVLLLKCKN